MQATIELFEKYDIIKNNKIKYASELLPIDFLTDNVKSIPKNIIMFVHNNADRNKTIKSLSEMTNNINLAIQIEAGVFEFTLVYAATKNITKELLTAIYNDKVNELLRNLDVNKNKILLKDIVSGKIKAQMIAFMKPQELDPESWKDVMRKFNLKEDKKKNIAVVDIYSCPRCKLRRCKMMQLQLRSADEGIQTCLTCTNCYHRFMR